MRERGHTQCHCRRVICKCQSLACQGKSERERVGGRGGVEGKNMSSRAGGDRKEAGLGGESKTKQELRRCDEDVTKLTYESGFNSHGAERQMERTRITDNRPLKVLLKSQSSLQMLHL